MMRQVQGMFGSLIHTSYSPCRLYSNQLPALLSRQWNRRPSTKSIGRCSRDCLCLRVSDQTDTAIKTSPTSATLEKTLPPLYVFNSISKKKEIFVPLNPPKVTLYVCGVTPYDFSHLGHARAYVAFDLLHCVLSRIGYDVLYVRNYTDIDDKIIKRAKELQETEKSLSNRFIDEFNKDMELLGCQKPTFEPKATEFIPQMIDMIKDIIHNGHGYELDGDVYFDTQSIDGYGRLSKRSLDDNRPGERVSVDTRKKHPTDFALWKSAKEGEPFWSSPWGDGRPGWHIECSAMISDIIGPVVDIHGGGSDLIFPHHENELVQSQAAADPCDKEVMLNGGKDFVKYWMHNGFVNIDDEKMSKSLGNFLTIRDVLQEHHPLTLRWMLLSSQYRQPLNFSETIIEQSASTVYYLYQTLSDAKNLVKHEEGGVEMELLDLYKSSELVQEMVDHLCDDLNSMLALGVLQQHLKVMNELLHTKKGKKIKDRMKQLSDGCRDVNCCLELMGFQTTKPDAILQEMKNLTLKRAQLTENQILEYIDSRNKARLEKDYERADAIRKELNEVGIAMCDSSQGTTWRPI